VLEGLPRFAAPRTRPLVKAIAARAKDLDWRQTYSQADFGAIAGGVLLLGRDTEYPAHSHEAEELYLPLAGHALWRSAEKGWRLRPPGGWIPKSRRKIFSFCSRMFPKSVLR
jgi:Dimethlysulfonioproprionate lyase